ncbi:non-ribosomal peptide synthetase [Sesbania bispinosa]|nr:non-ribosomal peptide synthetase [Sesbania bispinosa]
MDRLYSTKAPTDQHQSANFFPDDHVEISRPILLLASSDYNSSRPNVRQLKN